MTGWRGHQVLYFGDHPYSDLADVTLQHGWRTGAIIKELTVGFFKFCLCLIFFFFSGKCIMLQSGESEYNSE